MSRPGLDHLAPHIETDPVPANPGTSKRFSRFVDPLRPLRVGAHFFPEIENVDALPSL
jgi:hypothetical protein